MNVGLMQIRTPLSPSWEIFCPVMTKIKYMYTTTRMCTQCPKLIVNVASKNWNLKLVNPYTNTTILAYFFLPTIKSRKRTRTCMRHGENFYAMPMHVFFLITGPEHDETTWTGAYHKYDQRRLRRACAFVQTHQGLAAH